MTLSLTPSDVDLLRQMIGGDEHAFTLLYGRRQGGVYRFALQMSGSRGIAEDVTQEVFMVLIREAHRYDPERGSVAAYLYGIARNHVLRRMERDRLFVQFADATEEDHEMGSATLVAEGDPLGDLTKNEMIDEVRQAVFALPARYREVVVLCDLHEMSYAEAAAVVGCAVGTIRSRLHRARALLVEKLRSAKSAGRDRLVNQERCFA
ncbi:MAG TPA: sigma-70 family RNA polymerase sigma factor, partial [Blastocatellia bacterium]|nr:sigma-70 family RNA polymerase sigma factor [Blastocatellia bacterium]